MFAQRIAQADLRTCAILINKTLLDSPERFTQGSRLYHYAVRLLTERISWYCRDHLRKNDEGDGSVCLDFSNRATLDYERLAAYLQFLDDNRTALDYRAAPGVIVSKAIASHTQGKRLGLQLADAVASSYFYAVEPGSFGFTEDAYARLLQPVTYRREGLPWGYGIKLVPKEAERERISGAILSGWDSGDVQ